MITAAYIGLLRAIESDKRKENWGAGYKKSLNKKTFFISLFHQTKKLMI